MIRSWLLGYLVSRLLGCLETQQLSNPATLHGILSRYFASATSFTEAILASAEAEIGESTSICMNASLPRCLREQESEAMLILSSAMIFVTSEIMPGRSR